MCHDHRCSQWQLEIATFTKLDKIQQGVSTNLRPKIVSIGCGKCWSPVCSSIMDLIYFVRMVEIQAFPETSQTWCFRFNTKGVSQIVRVDEAVSWRFMHVLHTELSAQCRTDSKELYFTCT